MSRAIDSALAHMRDLGTPSIEVPEWKIDGKPLKIFWKPMTLAERETIFRGGELKLTGYAEVLVKKALDENGEHLFTLEDAPKLRNAVESGVVQRIALAILQAATIEDLEKN